MAKGRSRAQAHFARASVPRDVSPLQAEALFDPGAQPISDEARSNALAAYRNLLLGIGERLIFDLEDGAGGLDLQQAVEAMLSSRVERSPQLASALLHRAEELRLEKKLTEVAGLGRVFSPHMDSEGFSIVEHHLAQDDEALAKRAEHYARLKKIREGQGDGPVLLLDELPAPLAADCYWTLAAHLCAAAPLETVEAAVVSVRRLLAEHEVTRSPQHAALSLAIRLEERGELGARQLIGALMGADPILAAAVVAVRAEITLVTAWTLIYRSNADIVAAILKAVGLRERDAVQAGAIILFAAGAAKSLEGASKDVTAHLQAQDEASLSEMLGWWRLAPQFRSALGRIDHAG